MKLSTRTKYGTRALVELALAEGDEVVSTRQVADEQDISFKYLEQIMSALRAGGLVNSRRGQNGGYTLSRRPEQINLLQVYRVLEGSTAPADCVDDPEDCPMGAECAPRETWVEIAESVREVLENTTLRDLKERHRQKQRDGTPTYHI
ncbi:MAG: Rrf2 family transcriptional regulator [Planctomycetota bacterium]